MKRIFLMIFALTFSIVTFSQSNEQAKQLIYHERYKTAADMLFKETQNNPQNQEAWYLLAIAYLEQDSTEKAKEALQRAPQEILNEPVLQAVYGHILLKQHDTENANTYFENAMKETRRKDATVLKEIARAYINIKDADANKAIELLNQAIKRDKKNPELYVMLGDAYSKLTNGSDAYTAYNKALSLDPNYARASYRLGKIFTSQKNPVYVQYFTDALTADSLYAPALYEMYYHYYFRDVEKAMDYLKKYIAASDNNVENDYLVTDMLYLNKDYTAAIDKGQQLIQQQGDSISPRIYKLVANSYKKTSDFENAKSYMQKYFQNNTDTSYLGTDYETMAEIYDSLNHHEDSAAHYYELAATNAKKDADKYRFYKKIADIYAREKDYANQAEWLQKYYASNPSATNVDLFNCGIAFYNAHEYKMADSTFGMYTEKYPEQKYGYYWRARSNAAIDTAMEEGLAIPHYLKVIELAQQDTTDDLNKKRLIESYGYIASFKANHDKDYESSKEYFEKVLELAPDNEDAKRYVGILQKFIDQDSNNKEAENTEETPASSGASLN